MPRNSRGRRVLVRRHEVSTWKLRLSERQISLILTKAAADCTRGGTTCSGGQAEQTARPRSSSLGGHRFPERRPVQQRSEVSDGITDGKNCSIPKSAREAARSLVHRQEHGAAALGGGAVVPP